MIDPPTKEELLKTGNDVVAVDEAVACGAVIVDVRSPAEFAAGTVPGACTVPLFDEQQRATIGTLYRRRGGERAVEVGYRYGTEQLDRLVESFAPYREKPVAVMCARGGMRSRAVVNMLAGAGIAAVQIQGGYKTYRQQVLERLSRFSPKLIVIHGLTGTGKTRIVERLDHAIDLEALAGHRSSLFGALDSEPANQRNFESGLAKTISQLAAQPYFIEGESRKIGRVFIPQPLASAMKNGVMVRVECSLETRISRIVADYPVDSAATEEKVIAILSTLRQKLGGNAVAELVELLQRRDLRQFVRRLLLDYYDKRYARSMRHYRYAHTLSSEDIDSAADELLRFRASLG